MKEYQTFIVRIWADDSSEVTRGHIQHVRTRRTLYFQNAVRMLRFIDEYLAPLSLSGNDEQAEGADDQTEDEGNTTEQLERLLADDLGDSVLPKTGGGE